MEYYEYILVFFGEILSISINVIELLQDIQGTFNFMDDNIDNPSNYVGAVFFIPWVVISYGL